MNEPRYRKHPVFQAPWEFPGECEDQSRPQDRPSSLSCNWEPGAEQVPFSVSLQMRPVKPSGQRQ